MSVLVISIRVSEKEGLQGPGKATGNIKTRPRSDQNDYDAFESSLD